jgi:predicted ATP-grasp superfamily ATP-dependent carboligase
MQPLVLATDAQERAVLAAIRCLRLGGFCITAAATSRAAPGLWSRAPVRRRLAPDPRADVGGFIDKLEVFLRERPHDLLLAGTDASLLAISRHRDRLAPHVRLGLPDHAVVERALDKTALAQGASAVGLTSPDERVVDGIDDARAAAAAFGYPVLLKPLHTVVERAGVVHRVASRVAFDEAHLREELASIGDAGIVQRRLEGSVISFGGVATDEGLLGYVVSRYERTWPPEGGNVAYSETIASPAGLVERVQALVARVGWTGLFELELIEQGEGRWSAIDLNPRAYGSLGLARAAGVPLAAMWCRWLLGERGKHVPPARVGVRYRWEDADLRHLAWGLGATSTRQAAFEVARPRRDTTHAYFELRDPAPLLARALQVVRIAHGRSKDGR